MTIALPILTFVSVLLLVLSRKPGPADDVERRLRGVKDGLQGRRDPLDQPFSIRVVSPTVHGLARLLLRLLPTTWIEATSRKLVWAGGPIQLGAFVVLWALSAVALPALSYIWAGNLGLSGLMYFMTLGGGVLFGVYGPQYWLNTKVNQRRYLTRKSLPDALDLMVTSVEAGLSLDSALMRVSEYNNGPLQRELARAMEDMSLGQRRAQAMSAMAERLNVTELTTFVNTLNQAEVTGAPIGQVLRVQAEQIRVARRQSAEAQAQRAPLLMLIPLVLLILPSLFIVLLSPAAMTIVEVFGEKGFGG